MSDSTAGYYPPRVPERRRRPETPRIPRAAGTAPARSPLWEAVLHALRDQGIVLVNFSRRGPYIAEVVFKHAGQHWRLRSEAPRAAGWTQESLEDWLYGDLVDVQLQGKLASINQVRFG